jgi:hypothetical protein
MSAHPANNFVIAAITNADFFRAADLTNARHQPNSDNCGCSGRRKRNW